MSTNFNISEKYRKYVIGLQVKEAELYTVWGTDMEASEEDKLLVDNGRLLVFQNLNTLKLHLKTGTHPYLDMENFEKWIFQEDLNHVYNTNDFQLLDNFVVTFLEKEETALSVLHCLNLIQDFFIQINENDIDELYENDCIVQLKDFIYNNYFWKSRSGNLSYMAISIEDVIDVVKRITDIFYSKFELVI